MPALPVVELETGPNPAFTVIWLHGLGASANDFVPVIPELHLPARLAVRFIFPQAPVRPVTVNGGYMMPAWYDILEMSIDQRKVDQAGIIQSVEQIRQLITHENQRGVATGNIVLAGFSQGGAIAYQTGLTHPERLAGIIALSTYVPDASLLSSSFNPVQRQLPIFAGHGVQDGMVSLAMGREACTLVNKLGACVSWHEYAMEHQVCLSEIRDIGQWLGQRMSDGKTCS